MKIRETGIRDLLIFEPQVFRDPRGYFLESFRKSWFKDLDNIPEFIQDNQSQSSYGVIRGLHYQKEPHTQTKLIRVTEGMIYDVAVDIRSGSPTFGKWFGIEISAENHLQLLIPGGFAHGFSVLSERATVFYKCDVYYHPDSEAGIHFNDQDLKIDWKTDLKLATVSEKDRNLPHLKDL